MNTLTYLTLDKDVRQLRRADIDAFAARISGGCAHRRRMAPTTTRARSGTARSIAVPR